MYQKNYPINTDNQFTNSKPYIKAVNSGSSLSLQEPNKVNHFSRNNRIDYELGRYNMTDFDIN